MNEEKGIGTGSSRSKEASDNKRIDFEKEFRESFNKALLYEKFTTTALEYVISTNPAKIILRELDGLDDKLKQTCKERIEGQMITWLGMFEKTLSEGESLPVDLIGLASDLAKKDRSD
ncbi:MAG: hypothetical protein BV457_05395 [Thermoplasmata archaeon M9B1D]|nr:MAG: hypothetical protein BV457_05395 [Thermoplasmata archaeon M9B1D]